MPVSTKVSFNTDGLSDLISKLTTQKKARVGLFGRNSQRDNQEGEAPIDNVTLGAIHEFGSETKGIPPRSFIRMPLEERAKDLRADIVREIGDYVRNNQSEETALKRIGIAAENIIQKAFDTKGFGKWPALKASTIAKKGSASPLIDTAEMRRAITSEVK